MHWQVFHILSPGFPCNIFSVQIYGLDLGFKFGGDV